MQYGYNGKSRVELLMEELRRHQRERVDNLRLLREERERRVRELRKEQSRRYWR